MRHATRWLLAVPVVGLVMLLGVLPAAADKPTCPGHPSCGKDPPPGDGPALVDVTMRLVNEDGEGLDTNCDGNEDGKIEMVNTGSRLEPTGDPVLRIEMKEVAWERIFPDPISGEGFSGCHRMLLDPDEPEAVLGGLVISLDPSGAVSDIRWHFDYWYVWQELQRGKKTQRVLADFEHFTLGMDETTLRWDEGTPQIPGGINGTLTASFGMFYHVPNQDYQPLEGSPRELSFTIVAEPRQ